MLFDEFLLSFQKSPNVHVRIFAKLQEQIGQFAQFGVVVVSEPTRDVDSVWSVLLEMIAVVVNYDSSWYDPVQIAQIFPKKSQILKTYHCIEFVRCFL